PSARYRAGGELVAARRNFAPGQLVSARTYSGWELIGRWLRRHWRLVAVSGAALVTLLVIGVVSAVRIAAARSAERLGIARLELDEGRLAYLGGDASRALAYLGAALRDGADGPVARYLVARAAAQRTTQRFAAAVHPGGIFSVRVAPDGRAIASAGNDGSAGVVDAATGSLLQRLAGHRGPVLAAELSPAGDRLASAGLDGKILIWDPGSGRLLATLVGHKGYVAGVRFSPDGGRLASWDLLASVRVWDATRGSAEVVVERAHDGRISAGRWLDGARLVTAARDGLVKVWSAADGRPLCTGTGHETQVLEADLSPDRTRIASADDDGMVVVHDASCATLLRFRAGPLSVNVVRYGPDARALFTAGVGAAGLGDADTGLLRAALDDPNELVQAAAFSPDGARLATAGHGRTIKIWSARDGCLLARLAGHAGQVRSVAWAPDGAV